MTLFAISLAVELIALGLLLASIDGKLRKLVEAIAVLERIDDRLTTLMTASEANANLKTYVSRLVQ